MTIASLLALFGAGRPSLSTREGAGARRRLRRAGIGSAVGLSLIVVALGGRALLATDRPGSPTQPPVATETASAGRSCASGASSACAAPAIGAARGDVDVPRGKPRLIEFHSEHCTACARMAPIVRDLEERCAHGGDTILRVTIDDDAGEALAARYGVRHLPTFVGVDSAGDEVERVVGEQPRARLAGLLGDVRGEACEAL